mgnify:CR=1 FL=1
MKNPPSFEVATPVVDIIAVAFSVLVVIDVREKTVAPPFPKIDPLRHEFGNVIGNVIDQFPKPAPFETVFPH